MARIKPQALLIQSKKKKVPSRISATTIVLCTSIVALMILLFSTYRHWSRRSKGDQTGTSESVFEDTNAFIDSKKYDIPGYAILNTSKGPVVVELFKDGSPQIVDKFIDLWCNSNCVCPSVGDQVMKPENIAIFHEMRRENMQLYSRENFNRNFVIHGGNSEGLGAAEDWTSKGKLHGQLATSPKHEAFMLGTSKTGDRKVFELYITTAPIPDLNDKLLVFGRVIKGEDVVQEIEEVDTDEHYQPKSPMGIINIILKRELQE